jgi:hypothetical protein
MIGYEPSGFDAPAPLEPTPCPEDASDAAEAAWELTDDGGLEYDCLALVVGGEPLWLLTGASFPDDGDEVPHATLVTPTGEVRWDQDDHDTVFGYTVLKQARADLDGDGSDEIVRELDLQQGETLDVTWIIDGEPRIVFAEPLNLRPTIADCDRPQWRIVDGGGQPDLVEVTRDPGCERPGVTRYTIDADHELVPVAAP